MKATEEHVFTTPHSLEKHSAHLLAETQANPQVQKYALKILAGCAVGVLATTLTNTANNPLITRVIHDVSCMVAGHSTAMFLSMWYCSKQAQNRHIALYNLFGSEQKNNNILTTTKSQIEQYGQKIQRVINRTKWFRYGYFGLCTLGLLGYLGVENARMNGNRAAQIIANFSIFAFGMSSMSGDRTDKKQNELNTELNRFYTLFKPIKITNNKTAQTPYPGQQRTHHAD